MKRLRTELETQRLACQIAVNDLTCDVLDVEAMLAYAEHVLMNLQSLWRDCEPTHRQALGRVLFPARVQFDGVSCQTACWAFGFSGLEGLSKAGSELVDLTGIEPVRRARRAKPTCLSTASVRQRPSVARELVDLTRSSANCSAETPTDLRASLRAWETLRKIASFVA